VSTNQVSLLEYPNRGILQTEAFKDKRLIKKEGLYQIVTYLGDSKTDPDQVGTPRGLYDFVVLATHADACFVRCERMDRMARRSRQKKPINDVDRGHSSIAQGQSVLMAGTIAFGGGVTTGETKAGELIWWENKSGHYFKGGVHPPFAKYPISGAALKAHVEYQTQHLKCADGSPLLPMDKFQEWDGDL
jgi:hypothetical protein